MVKKIAHTKPDEDEIENDPDFRESRLKDEDSEEIKDDLLEDDNFEEMLEDDEVEEDDFDDKNIW